MTKEKIIYRITILSFSFFVFQFSFGQNLIPNPSFEEVNHKPTDWISVYEKFNEALVSWTSPTQGSPDYFYKYGMAKFRNARPKINLPDYAPKSGDYMVGIKVFGCKSGTMFCKEYLQVELLKPLISGDEYFYEYWVNPVQSSIKVNSFGIVGNNEELKDFMNSGLLDIYPIGLNDSIIDAKPKEWKRISGTFISDDNYKYIIIGNFYKDKFVKSKGELNGIDYAYYFIDDVTVRPLYSNETDEKYEIGQILVLNHIEFEFDKSTLLSTSFDELNDLITEMNNKPDIFIEIHGHTDHVGTEDYNKSLSKRRAESVKFYLMEQGISANRVKSKGFGSKYPLIGNDSEGHQKINRRVEIKIMKKEE